jgi:hypothetical protein
MSQRAQAGVDELGCAVDVGSHGPVDLGGCAGAVQVCGQPLELDTPQAEQRGGRDLRLRVVRAQPGLLGQDRRGDGDELVHHVALMGPQ